MKERKKRLSLQGLHLNFVKLQWEFQVMVLSMPVSLPFFSLCDYMVCKGVQDVRL